MTDRKFNLHDGRKGSALAVRVTPRASRNEIVELLDDGTIQVQGPAKAMTPLETVVHVDGGEWALVPEDVTVRRVLPPAA